MPNLSISTMEQEVRKCFSTKFVLDVAIGRAPDVQHGQGRKEKQRNKNRKTALGGNRGQNILAQCGALVNKEIRMN